MSFVFSAAAALLLAAAPSPETQANESSARRPNIVVIMTDDMGYSDLGCFGGEVATPNIDSLAGGGVRFREFYNCSRCCQTRASLLTGYYAQRVGMDEFGRTMDLTVPTVAERLQEAGYHTAMSGKWHLSELPDEPRGDKRLKWMDHQLQLDMPLADPDSLPTQRGFEQFYGIVWGVVNHFDPFSLCEGETPVEEVPEDYYSTDAITDYTEKYIREFAADDKPFFIYTAYTAPHWPIQAPPESIEKYQGKYADGWDALRAERFRRQVELGLFDENTPLGPVINDGAPWRRLPAERRAYLAAKMAVHAAMIDRIDVGVGRIVDALRETGQLDNTIILVLSDNGASPEIPGGPGYDRYAETREGQPALREAELQEGDNAKKLGSEESYAGIGSPWASAVNTPLRYWKMESYDGGCRTPLIVHWPQGLKGTPGRIVSDVGHVIDLAPTMLELAGVADVESLKLDGTSLTPVLDGETIPGERTLFFAHYDGRGVRNGRWKASKLPRHEWELFDIEQDPGETTDISAQHPEQLKRLVRGMSTWRQTSTVRPVAPGENAAAAPATTLP